MLRHLRIPALILIQLVLALVLSFEGLYGLQLRRLADLPRRPTVTASEFTLRALFLECDSGDFVSEPIWAGTIVQRSLRFGLAVIRDGLRVHRPPGAPTRVAKDWLSAHHSRRWFAGKEFALTVWLSRHFTAAELAQARYDHAYFGRGAVGLEEAAASYFCKWPEELETHELATLVGFLQSPGRWHTFGVGRRSFMLREFVRQGLVSPAEAAAAAARPLDFASEPCWFVPDRPRMSSTAPSPDGGKSPVVPAVPAGL